MANTSSGAIAHTFTFSAQSLRVIMRNGNPWFVASDVCAAVGIKNHSDAVARLDDDEKGVASTDTLGGQQEMLVVNESGLNAIILRCRDAMTPGTPAHKYRKWVTSEVLPAIRKTGRYEAPQAPAHPQGEKLSANDWRNLKNAVWFAVKGFRFEGVWTQAVWYYLRRALGVPAPGGYSVDHLPKLAQELQTVIAATEQVHTLLIAIEQEAAKRILRKGECADVVVAELRAQAMARLNAMQSQLVTLPSYLAKDVAAIAQRAPNRYDHGNNEQPEAFGKGAAA